MAEKEYKTSEAQRRATRAWEARNREKTRFDTARRNARRYIQKFAQEKDLQEVEQWVADKRKELKKQD